MRGEPPRLSFRQHAEALFGIKRLFTLCALFWAGLTLAGAVWQGQWFAIQQERSLHLLLAFATITLVGLHGGLRQVSPYARRLRWLVQGVAALGIGAALYAVLAYHDIQQRPGLTLLSDRLSGIGGVTVLLLLGWWLHARLLVVLAALMMLYAYSGFSPVFPELLAHGGQSLNRLASVQWFTMEGVFGVGLGAAVREVALFLLWAALLKQAGTAIYWLRWWQTLLGPQKLPTASFLSFSMLGTFSGSPLAHGLVIRSPLAHIMREHHRPIQHWLWLLLGSVLTMAWLPPLLGGAGSLLAAEIGLQSIELAFTSLWPAIAMAAATGWLLARQERYPPPRVSGRVRSIALALLWLAGQTGSVLLLKLWQLSSLPALTALALGWMIIGILFNRYLPAQAAPPGERPSPVRVLMGGLHHWVPWALPLATYATQAGGLIESLTLSVLAALLLVLLQRLISRRAMAQHWPQRLLAALQALAAASRSMADWLTRITVIAALAGLIQGALSLTGSSTLLYQLVVTLAQEWYALAMLLIILLSMLLGLGQPLVAKALLIGSLLAPLMQQVGQQYGVLLPSLSVVMALWFWVVLADFLPGMGIASGQLLHYHWKDVLPLLGAALLLTLCWLSQPVWLQHWSLLKVESWVMFGVILLAVWLWCQLWRIAPFPLRPWEQGFLGTAILLLLWPQWLVSWWYPPYQPLPADQLIGWVARLPDQAVLRITLAPPTQENEAPTADYQVILPLFAAIRPEERLSEAGLTLAQQPDGYYQVTQIGFNSAAEQAGITPGSRIAAVDVRQDYEDARWLWPLVLLSLIGWVIWRRQEEQRRWWYSL